MEKRNLYQKEVQISPKFSVSDWNKLDLHDSNNRDWSKAVDIFSDRINGRFLIPIKVIEENVNKGVSQYCGFTILAIDCLIIETLYQFYNGVDETDVAHKEAFLKFFKGSNYFKPYFNREKAFIFYSHFRCGILHQAQTKKKSKIKIFQLKMVELSDPKDINQGLIIDRKRFHQALCDEISDYMSKLRNPKSPDDYVLRKNFKTKMSFILKGINQE